MMVLKFDISFHYRKFSFKREWLNPCKYGKQCKTFETRPRLYFPELYIIFENVKRIRGIAPIIEHRLVLLMHICDGFAVAYLGGDTNNNSGNINVVLKRLDCDKKYKIGAKMLGISSSKAKDALGEDILSILYLSLQA